MRVTKEVVWVPVNEERPKRGSEILIYTPEYSIEPVYVGKDSFYHDERTGQWYFEDYDGPVTHWAMFPEPPE